MLERLEKSSFTGRKVLALLVEKYADCCGRLSTDARAPGAVKLLLAGNERPHTSS
jgi:hypothetical protein